ncbi:hypothetical protein FS837_005877 [Tulasnella sp. UAMH 9824]|nr:hypothetical protein FS837_005877 [Tulasnella sp. UAMH 9824]
MSRQILAYDDFDSPHATPPPLSDGRAPSQPAPANGPAAHSGKEPYEISPGRHIGAGKKGKAEKRKQKQQQKQLHQGAKTEQGGQAAAGEDESARKRKKRKFEESLEHDRVHWDAQGQREYGTVEVKYDDDAGDEDPTGNDSQLGPTAPPRPQVKLEDALESMFEDAENDMSGSEVNAEESGPATARKPTATQQAKGKKVGNPKTTATTSGGASANFSKPGAGSKKEDKGKAVQKAPADTTGVLMDADAWDDSFLIDAWDAAMEEYQILNGPEADWKKDPVHKDSISSSANLQWQDIKPAASKDNVVKSAVPVDPASTAEYGTHGEGDDQMEDGEEEQGQGAVGADAPQPAIATLPAAFDISKMSKDEIFQKAVEASYWAGYWAAAYHAAAGTHTEAEL